MTEKSLKKKIRSKNIWLSNTRNNSVKISDLGEAGSSLHYDKTIRKGSTVNNNGVKPTGLGMSSLGGINSSLHCKESL